MQLKNLSIIFFLKKVQNLFFTFISSVLKLPTFYTTIFVVVWFPHRIPVGCTGAGESHLWITDLIGRAFAHANLFRTIVTAAAHTAFAQLRGGTVFTICCSDRLLGSTAILLCPETFFSGIRRVVWTL